MPERLRTGISTGACASAAATAAWRILRGEVVGASLTLRFNDGVERPVAIAGTRRHADGAEAWVVKDAGDDIDITHGATVRVRLRPGAAPADGDHLETCGAGRLFVRGGAGVGRATRAGLPVPPGTWAINPGPRRMITANLAAAGFTTGDLAVEIGVDGGEALARRTLNGVLGVVGGLSILGTTGVVHPCSHAAYIETIRVLARSAAAAGRDHLALATGGRTADGLAREVAGLDEVSIIRIGDFIGEALAAVHAAGVRRVTVGCMAGKLAKYALGHANTHAHRVAMELPALSGLLQSHGIVADPGEARSVAEWMGRLDEGVVGRIHAALADAALGHLRRWAAGVAVELVLFDLAGRRLGRYGDGAE